MEKDKKVEEEIKAIDNQIAGIDQRMARLNEMKVSLDSAVNNMLCIDMKYHDAEFHACGNAESVSKMFELWMSTFQRTEGFNKWPAKEKTGNATE